MLPLMASGGGAAGGVTSVGFNGDGTVLTATTSGPITTSGTLTASLLTQTANKILAGPTSGGALAPTFRSLVAADLPSPNTTGYGGWFGQTIWQPAIVTTSANITANNKIRLKLFTVPFPLTVTGLAITVTTGVNSRMLVCTMLTCLVKRRAALC